MVSPAALAGSRGFIENRGQWDSRILYYAPGARENGVLFAPNAPARVEARGELVTRYHFFRGCDPSSWRTNVRAYREIVYRDIRPGVDVVFCEDSGRITYQMVSRVEADAGRAGSTPGDSFNILVDDPDFLSWGTYLGGSDLDGVVDVALNNSGYVFVLGETYSPDLPATPGAYDETYNGWTDMFIARLSPDGSTLLWCAFLGSADIGVADTPISIALDASGNPVVTGGSSLGYPTTPGAYDVAWNGGDDVVVTKLSSDGSSLIWSTFLGGGDYEVANAFALDASDHVILTGTTYSTDFPTTPGSYDDTYSPTGDVFCAKLSSDGAGLLWSTFLGGGEGGEGYGIALDASGNPIVTGYAGSGEFPTTAGAYDQTWNGQDDAFVSKLSSTGSTLLWSTFLGGDGNDQGIALVVEPSDGVVVVGKTASAGFPTTLGVYQPTWRGGDDVFVSRLSANGSTLGWSTFLGGSSNDRVRDVALDSDGHVVMAGMIFSTGSSDFPTTSRTFDGSFNGGGMDGFVSKMLSDGSYLMWSSFLGGSGADDIRGLALDGFDNPVLAGSTDSSDFPTTPGAYDTSLNGTWSDGFIVRMTFDDPTGIVGEEAPSLNALLPCAPNPFARATRIRYVLDEERNVDLRVFDVLGRTVGVLDAGRRPAGAHEVSWDGRRTDGAPVAAGVYFVRLAAGGKTFERKIAVVR